MNTKEIVQSIGDKVTAIDLKLERLLNNADRDAAAQLGQLIAFLEEISRTISIKLTGEFPGAIELLEKRIDNFDLNIADSLKIFGDHLLSYEVTLEDRIKGEIHELGNSLKEQLEEHQQEHARLLEKISLSMDNLSRAIAGLYNRQTDFDTERLTQTLENLNAFLDNQSRGNKSFTGFWSRKKPASE